MSPASWLNWLLYISPIYMQSFPLGVSVLNQVQRSVGSTQLSFQIHASDPGNLKSISKLNQFGLQVLNPMPFSIRPLNSIHSAFKCNLNSASKCNLNSAMFSFLTLSQIGESFRTGTSLLSPRNLSTAELSDRRSILRNYRGISSLDSRNLAILATLRSFRRSILQFLR